MHCKKRSVLLLSLVLLFFPLDVPFTFDQQCLTVWIYQRHSEESSSVSLCLPAIKELGVEENGFQGIVTIFEAGRAPVEIKTNRSFVKNAV